MEKWGGKPDQAGEKDHDAATIWLSDSPEPLLRAPLMAHEIIAPQGSSGEIAEADDDSDVESPTKPCCRICLEHDNRRGNELISPCMCKGTQQFVHRRCLDQWRSVKEGFAFSHCTTCKAQYHLRVELTEAYCWRKLKFRLFVAKDILLVILIIQLMITAIGSLAYLVDTYLTDNYFRNLFNYDWFHALSEHTMPFYYCLGVLVSLVIFGVSGALMHCSYLLNNQQTANDHQVVDHNPSSQSGYVPVIMAAPPMHSSSFSRDEHSMNTDQRPDDNQGTNCNCCSSSSIDCSSGEEGCFILAIIVVVIFAVLGIFYGFVAATITFQRIWQRHYHILEKRELTKEYVVEDLHGNYSPPKLAPEHENRLKFLKLL